MSADRALASLRGLMRTVEELAYVPRKVAAIAAPKLSRLLQAEFRSGTDPYGRPWRRLSRATLARGRHPPPLTDTGRLRNGTGAKQGRAGIVLTVGAPYGKFHQYGTRHMPARRILPAFGMPASWRQALDDAAQQSIREAKR